MANASRDQGIGAPIHQPELLDTRSVIGGNHLVLADDLQQCPQLAPMLFGGESAPTSVAGSGLVRGDAIPLKLVGIESHEDGGVLIHYRV